MRISTVFSTLCLLGLAGPALVQPASADPQSEAGKLDEQARAYFRAGAFEEAAKSFQQAYELVAKSSWLFNAGRAYEEAGNKAKASELFARYLDVDPNGSKATEARARKAKLDKDLAAEAAKRHAAEQQAQRTAHIQETLARAQKHLAAAHYPEAAKAFDEVYVLSGDPELLFDKAEALRLGGERIAAIATYRQYQREASEGRSLDLARKRQAELEKAPEKEPKDSLTTAASSTPPDPILSTSSSAPMDSGSTGLRYTGIASMSLGVLALAGGGIMAAKAAGIESDLEGLEPEKSEVWDQDLYEEGQDAANLAGPLLAVGAVGVLGGALLYYFGMAEDGDKSSGISLTPSVGTTSQGVTLSGRF